MPNRVLRDWTASEKVDKLTAGAETFFTRLIMKADDFGLYWGNPKLLNSNLFPLKDFENSVILKWLNECVTAGLITRYKVDGKEYIQISGFDQRLRLMKSKFPDPSKSDELHAPSNDGQVTDNGRPETKPKRNETEVESETETETNPNAARLLVWPTFEDFWNLFDKKEDRAKAEAKFKKIPQVAREKIMEHLPGYVASTPDKKYRKNPITYLNNEAWNNEIILPNGKQESPVPDNIQALIDARRPKGFNTQLAGQR